MDGRGAHDLDEFYSGVEESVPLVEGVGHNLDALLDLFRTFGWGPHAGGEHVFVWYQPEVMLRSATADFRNVVDVIVGGAKELLVGEETNPDFDPTDANDWVPTRLDIVFACEREEEAQRVAKIAKTLSHFWEEDFHELDVCVEVGPYGRARFRRQLS